MLRGASVLRRSTSAMLPDRALCTAAVGIMLVLLVCSVDVNGQVATDPPLFAKALRTPGPPMPHAVLPAAGSAQSASTSSSGSQSSAVVTTTTTTTTTTTWSPGAVTTTTTSAPDANTTQLLTLVYSQLVNDSAYAIKVWCAALGSPAEVTYQMENTPVTASYGLWGPKCSLQNATDPTTTTLNFTLYCLLNISFGRSYVSVTTSANVLAELIENANNGLIPGILCIDTWSTENTKKEWAWIAGVAVAGVASVSVLVLLAVHLVYRRGYVSTTGPHLQDTGTYQDLEQARVSFEAKLGSHSSGLMSSPSTPPLAPPPLPLRELQ